MSISYGIIEEIYMLRDFCRTSYGIAAYANAEEDGTASILASARDVTADKEDIAALADLCTRLQLAPDHLPEIIADFFGDIHHI